MTTCGAAKQEKTSTNNISLFPLFFFLPRLVCADPWLLRGLLAVPPHHDTFPRETTLDHSPKDYYYVFYDRRCHVALNDWRNLRQRVKDIPREADDVVELWINALRRRFRPEKKLSPPGCGERVEPRRSLCAAQRQQSADTCVRSGGLKDGLIVGSGRGYLVLVSEGQGLFPRIRDCTCAVRVQIQLGGREVAVVVVRRTSPRKAAETRGREEEKRQARRRRRRRESLGRRRALVFGVAVVVAGAGGDADDAMSRAVNELIHKRKDALEGACR